jgi:predicted aspartyl protease
VVKFCGAMLAVALACGAAFADMPGDTKEADAEFFAGRFERAEKLYEAIQPASPTYENALRQLGAIALYENRLEDADRLLQLAIAKDPQDTRADLLLSETANRRDDFPSAARWLRQAGRPERALAYEVFPDTQPYSVTSPAKRVRVPFVATDPLPLVEARVNGKPGLFLIDTGAAAIVLDPIFAQGADVEMVSGETTGTFAGGRTAPVTYARIPKFSLGRMDVASVAAIMVSTAGFSGAAGGRPVAGVIGTSFLSHFRATIDYPGGALIFEPRDAAPFASPAIAEIPIWLVRDHFILARGQLNGGPEEMFFVDTGLAGSAFTAPASTLAAAGIAIPATQSAQSSSLVGQSAAVPIVIDSLSLGTLRRENLSGLYGPFPPSLESSTGVRIAGIVSHAFFRPYAVTFDFVRMKLLLRKPQT